VVDEVSSAMRNAAEQIARKLLPFAVASCVIPQESAANRALLLDKCWKMSYNIINYKNLTKQE